MSAQTKGLAALLAAQGRNGDDELIHVNKRELAALERLGRRHGIETTVNPNTGLREAFNWGSTIGGVLGGVAGTFAAPFTAGVINPYTGAALGSAAGTKLSGGSNEDALMNGAIAGVAAWGLGGASDALGSLGQEATKEATKEATGAAVRTGVQETTKAGAQNLATNILPDAGYYGAESLGQQGVNTYTAQGTKEMLAAGANPNLTTSIGPGQNTLMQSGANPDYWSNVSKGIQSLDTPGKLGEFAVQNKGSLLAGGLGAYALGSGAGNTEDTSSSTLPTSTSNYYGQTYYTPYGERRTRAVAYAGGGGISALGSYSDGGQLLRGPGDGVSDSIPATIADQRPARLAEGEFVVPARAVSELGNGSTEAGSKQLYAMLDRIAKKRKKGKGLAYEANPKKLLPA